MNRILLWVVTLIIMTALCGCMGEKITYMTDSNNKVINLSFSPIPLEVLKEEKPEDNWVKVKSIKYWKTENQRTFAIHIYEDVYAPGNIQVFLESEGKLYMVYSAWGYGVEDVHVELKDAVPKEGKEIIITGSLGASYSELKMIGYDDKSGWVNLLSMGTPRIIDLDGDGKDEYIASSAGSMPPYVYIYRWNGNCFEMADAAKDAMGEYALIYNKPVNGMDKWVIETGSAGDEKNKYIFEYKDGRLIEIKSDK